MAPRAFLLGAMALLAVTLAPVAMALRVLAVVATAEGRELVAVDEHLVVARRVALDAPVVALAAFAASEAAVYAGLRDGRVLKLDFAGLAVDASVRIGQTLTGLAASSDGRYLAAATPSGLVLLDPELVVLRELAAQDLEARRFSPVTAIADDPRRRSFLAALPGLPELWEVSYDDAAPPIYPGLVHDFRLGEGIAVPGKFNARRVPLDAPIDDMLPDPFGADVIGSGPAAVSWQVINLHVRRRIVTIAAATPAGAGARWQHAGRALVAVPEGAALRLVDASTWRDAARAPLPAPARLVRTHERAAHAWIAARGNADAADRLLAIDKARVVLVADVPLAAGARVADLAFAHDGTTLLVLVAGPCAALVSYDERTRTERGRLALDAPLRLLVPAPQRRTASSK